LVTLANKMASVMATNIGPAGDEIVEILSEAQKLMGLAREEQSAASQALVVASQDQNNTAATSSNWQQMVEQQTATILKEQISQERLSRMAKHLSDTEDNYMKVIAESQKTVATAAVERDALLQLASKLEQQTRLQSNREAGVVQMLNQKTTELDFTTRELQQAREAEQAMREERDRLLLLVEAQSAQLSAGSTASTAVPISSSGLGEDSPDGSVGEEVQSSSWPNPIKWLLNRQDSSPMLSNQADPPEPKSEDEFDSDDGSALGLGLDELSLDESAAMQTKVESFGLELSEELEWND